MGSLVPRPNPAFQSATLKSWDVPGYRLDVGMRLLLYNVRSPLIASDPNPLCIGSFINN